MLVFAVGLLSWILLVCWVMILWVYDSIALLTVLRAHIIRKGEDARVGAGHSNRFSYHMNIDN